MTEITAYDMHLRDVQKIYNRLKRDRKGKITVYYTAEEELQLHGEYLNGDKKSGEKLLLSQLKHVISITNKFKTSTVPSIFHSDLLSVGYQGLITALNTFNPEKGTFATWTRRCVTTTLLLYIKDVTKFESGIDGFVESGNRIISSTEENGETELFDLIADDSIEDDEEAKYKEQIVQEVLSSLPLRDKEIVSYFFFQNKRKKDLPYLLTPIYENEWDNIYKYGSNVITIKFKSNDGKLHNYKINVLSFFKNDQKNEILLENNDYITFISHRYEKCNSKFEQDTFKCELRNVDINSIQLEFNGKKIEYQIGDDGILNVPLTYNVGYICSDINSRLQKTMDKLRTNKKILALKFL